MKEEMKMYGAEELKMEFDEIQKLVPDCDEPTPYITTTRLCAPFFTIYCC